MTHLAPSNDILMVTIMWLQLAFKLLIPRLKDFLSLPLMGLGYTVWLWLGNRFQVNFDSLPQLENITLTT